MEEPTNHGSESDGVAQSQGVHLEWFAFQPAKDALNLDVNHVAAADRSSLTVISLKLKHVCIIIVRIINVVLCMGYFLLTFSLQLG